MKETAPPEPPGNESRPKRLSSVLTFIFAVALVMGPGPGIYLVNPDPTSNELPATVFGLPILYAWGLFWFAVEATVLLIAYFKIWSRE